MALSPKEVLEKTKSPDEALVTCIEEIIDREIKSLAAKTGGCLAQGQTISVRWNTHRADDSAFHAGPPEQRLLKRKYQSAGWQSVEVRSDEICLKMPRYRGATRAPTD